MTTTKNYLVSGEPIPITSITGDATVDASGVLTLASGVVTNAKAATMAPYTLKGNNTAATATSIDLTVAQVRALLVGPRVQSVTSAATVTAVCSTDDEVLITAQAAALNIANPSGTAAPQQTLIYRIKDNGTARAISFGTEFRAMGNTLPTTTVLSKTLYLGFKRNATDSKWDLIAKAQEA